jgi:hypothetical protein
VPTLGQVNSMKRAPRSTRRLAVRHWRPKILVGSKVESRP